MTKKTKQTKQLELNDGLTELLKKESRGITLNDLVTIIICHSHAGFNFDEFVHIEVHLTKTCQISQKASCQTYLKSFGLSTPS